ncbi:MAG: endonuclease III [Bacteroidetes bacterium]|nr:endonuclease III [Bacteroidota bacterium]
MKTKKFTTNYWETIFSLFSSVLKSRGAGLPSVSEIAESNRTPFRVLISTIISLRTKDAVTLASSNRLFSRTDTPITTLTLGVEEIEKLIYPAGFYKTKARNILEISRILLEQYNGLVPSDKEQLLALPGVGIKTANLTLNMGFGIDAICVDTHVHRISNRCGWIQTKTPEESEKALELVLPQKFWIPLNELLVSFGQQICTPVSPRCSECPIQKECLRVGVAKTR